MLKAYLLQHIWLIVVFWVCVYCSDYYLTILGARLYRKYLSRSLAIEGSYELTPVFQKDIDALRLFSRAFTLRLVLSVFIIIALWWLNLLLGDLLDEDLPIFIAVMGGLFLREAAVHMRHFRMIAMAYWARDPGSFTGTLVQSRALSLKISAAEIISFAGLYFLIAWMMGSWAFFGGGVFCLVTAVQQGWQSRRVGLARKLAQ
jgi:hypothetical protein